MRLVIPLFGLAALGFAISLGIAFGAVSIPLADVWAIIARRSLLALSAFIPPAGDLAASIVPDWSDGRERIVFDVRFPRALLAALVGAGLAIVGAALQSATRNPLADPHLLGVSSGAALGAIVALLHTGLIFGLLTTPLFAFIGALGATALVMLIAGAAGSHSAEKLVLAGIAISFILAACGSLLIYLGDPRAAHLIVFWMLGGFGLARFEHLIYPALAFLGVFGWLMLRARELNALAMGDETALTLGVPVRRFRMTLFAATALLTGVMVAFSGTIGFIGLMAPHAARFMTGSDNLRVIPVSALIGAIALVLADLAGRTILAPEDLPVGVVTGLVGGAAFVLMLMRR
jgi:iron complex transport system permease protein